MPLTPGERAPSVQARPARPALRERTIAELVQLHADAERLAQEVGPWSGVAARRRLRAARNAEIDLLRVLGFAAYGEFLAFVGPALAPPDIDLGPPVDVDRERARVRELERALGAARIEIEELRTKVAQVAPVAPAAPAGDAEPEAARSLREHVVRAAEELNDLREAAREVRQMVAEVGAELVAARLELLLATRRMKAGQPGDDGAAA